MASLTSLEEFKLARNKLRDIESIKYIKDLGSLKSLTLSGNLVRSTLDCSSIVFNMVPSLLTLDNKKKESNSKISLLLSPRDIKCHVIRDDTDLDRSEYSPTSIVTRMDNIDTHNDDPMIYTQLPSSLFNNITTSLLNLYASPSYDTFTSFVSDMMHHLPPPTSSIVSSLTLTLNNTRYMYSEGGLDEEEMSVLKNKERDVMMRLEKARGEEEEWKGRISDILDRVKHTQSDDSVYDQYDDKYLLADSIRDSIYVMKNEKEKLERELDTVRKECEVWRSDMDSIMESRETVQKDVETKRREYGDLIGKIHDMEITYDDIMNDIKILGPDVESLKASICILSEEKNKLSMEVLSKQDEIKSMDKQLISMRDTMKVEEERKIDIESCVNTMQQIVYSLKEEKDSIERGISEGQTEIERLNDIKTSLCDDIIIIFLI